ncbi:hypothetical protein BaRGS_00017067 [Batillaria attramentaria]|uniref:Uncharacterized protein n=1 Tax=Batillaria attramentaria TaxID=370345 RepID=A0ABD0KWV5_9CAEN
MLALKSANIIICPSSTLALVSMGRITSEKRTMMKYHGTLQNVEDDSLSWGDIGQIRGRQEAEFQNREEHKNSGFKLLNTYKEQSGSFEDLWIQVSCSDTACIGV